MKTNKYYPTKFFEVGKTAQNTMHFPSFFVKSSKR